MSPARRSACNGGQYLADRGLHRGRWEPCAKKSALSVGKHDSDHAQFRSAYGRRSPLMVAAAAALALQADPCMARRADASSPSPACATPWAWPQPDDVARPAHAPVGPVRLPETGERSSSWTAPARWPCSASSGRTTIWKRCARAASPSGDMIYKNDAGPTGCCAPRAWARLTVFTTQPGHTAQAGDAWRASRPPFHPHGTVGAAAPADPGAQQPARHLHPSGPSRSTARPRVPEFVSAEKLGRNHLAEALVSDGAIRDGRRARAHGAMSWRRFAEGRPLSAPGTYRRSPSPLRSAGRWMCGSSGRVARRSLKSRRPIETHERRAVPPGLQGAAKIAAEPSSETPAEARQNASRPCRERFAAFVPRGAKSLSVDCSQKTGRPPSAILLSVFPSFRLSVFPSFRWSGQAGGAA